MCLSRDPSSLILPGSQSIRLNEDYMDVQGSDSLWNLPFGGTSVYWRIENFNINIRSVVRLGDTLTKILIHQVDEYNGKV